MEYLLGNDVSTWQNDKSTPKNVDFIKMKSAGSKFCFFRAFFGLSKDTDFDYYWKASKEAGIPRGAYLFPLVTYSIEEQTKNFVNLLKPDKGEMYPVLDIETYKGNVPSANNIKTMIKIIEDSLGVPPIIYTGFYVWRDAVVGSNDSYFKDYPLWIATYAAQPMVPNPWTNWTFWQFSEGKGLGLQFGVESKDIDMDYFNGTQEQFNLFFNTDIVVPDPNPPIEPVNGIEYTTLYQMNVRTGAGTQYPILGSIPVGTKVVASDVAGNDAWVKISEGTWICKSLNGKSYLE